MEQKTLSAMPREQLKKGASRRLRRSGKIPAIMYGHSGTAPIIIDAREFSNKFKRITENTIINLQVGDKAYDVLVKDFQEDILKNRITHIDFYEIERGKVLRTNIPVHAVGTPVGVRNGGILEVMLHAIEVECLPKDIPESIEIDVALLEIGGSVHVGDIAASEGVKFLTSEDSVVVSVVAPRAVEDFAATAAAAEGEIEAEAAGAAEAEESEEESGEEE